MVNWKTIGIVFIILFVLETIFIIWVYSMGANAISNENKCAINICENNGATSYYYEDTSNICYCYNNGEEVYKEIMK